MSFIFVVFIILFNCVYVFLLFHKQNQPAAPWLNVRALGSPEFLAADENTQGYIIACIYADGHGYEGDRLRVKRYSLQVVEFHNRYA